jgi:hypothetical protein
MLRKSLLDLCRGINATNCIKEFKLKGLHKSSKSKIKNKMILEVTVTFKMFQNRARPKISYRRYLEDSHSLASFLFDFRRPNR